MVHGHHDPEKPGEEHRHGGQRQALGNPGDDHAPREEEQAEPDHRVEGKAAAQGWDHNGSRDRSCTEGAEQKAVAGCIRREAYLGHQREKSPDPRTGHHEPRRPDQHPRDHGGIPQEAKPLREAPEHRPGCGTPTRIPDHRGRDSGQCPEHHEEGEGIETEDTGRTDRSHEKAAEGGAEGAGEVEADAVERDGGGHPVAGDEVLEEGLPPRQVNRRSQAQQQKKHEQTPGTEVSAPCGGSHQRGGRHHPELGNREQASPVDKIRQGAPRHSEEEGGCACRGLHESDEQGGGGQRGHHPGRRRTVHDGPEIGDKVGDPEIAEFRLSQGSGSVVEEFPVHRRIRNLMLPMASILPRTTLQGECRMASFSGLARGKRR